MLITDIFYHKKYLVIKREIPKINTVYCLLYEETIWTDHLRWAGHRGNVSTSML